MATTTPTALPITTIQPDFPAVLADVRAGAVPSEAIWVSCYKTGAPSVHAKITAALDEVDRDAVRFEVNEGDVLLERSENGAYTVACPSLQVHKTPVLSPAREFADPAHAPPRPPRRITAFAIAPDGTQFACGYLDGAVRLSSTSLSPQHQTLPKTHLSTVTSLTFFPSSRVLLSAGADFALAVLPADPSSSDAPAPVRVLKGHTRAITATAIIARGRNVLSASADGTLRLWDVGGGAQLRAIRARGGIAAIALDAGAPTTTHTGTRDEREVGTEGIIVFCALHDGGWEALDLARGTSLFRSPPSSAAPLTAIAYSAAGLLATGSARGVVSVYPTSPALTSAPTHAFARNAAAITDFAFAPAGLVVGTDDGLAYVASFSSDAGEGEGEGEGEVRVRVRVRVGAELVGSDCDAVRVVRVRGGEVWVAGDDGVVRVYEP
ncbi:hypothetical protein HWV62_3991 [Athelia sp. TMB]|nr:hypothetical protein HWV62_3991 [Athelia sp. TMB]